VFGQLARTLHRRSPAVASPLSSATTRDHSAVRCGSTAASLLWWVQAFTRRSVRPTREAAEQRPSGSCMSSNNLRHQPMMGQVITDVACHPDALMLQIGQSITYE
jgi:hypothetical protein